MNELVNQDDQIKYFRSVSRAVNTQSAYKSDWQIFLDFCDARGFAHLPCEPRTLELFCADMAEVRLRTDKADDEPKRLSLATILRRVATISAVHNETGQMSPTEDFGFRKTLRGMRREFGGDSSPKRPLLTEHIRMIGEAYASSDNIIDKRDLAMILVGWAGAFRQSEIVALDLADIEASPSGLKIRVRRSKTDQESQGAFVGIPESRDKEVCPVRALFRYLQATRIESGPVFVQMRRGGHPSDQRLGPEGVNAAVKRAVATIDEPTAPYGGHSLRSGLATSAASNGATLQEIAMHGRWRSIETVLKNYIRPGTLFSDRNAAKLAGL